MKKLACSLSMLSVFLGGCAHHGPGLFGVRTIFGNTNLALAEPLFGKQENDCLDRPDKLLSLLTDWKNREWPISDGKAKKRVRCDAIAGQFQVVLGTFSLNPDPTKADSDRNARNEVIDAMIATSNQKCATYSALIKNTEGAMNGGLGVAAVVTAGLGAVVGGVATAKALAGAAAIISGSRATLNETYISNQTIHVLTTAFEKARRRQRRDITNREACPISQYSVMRGVEDAFAYHGSCSLLVGLAETSLAVERTDNPGIAVMRQQLAEAAAFKRQLDLLAKADDPSLVLASGPEALVPLTTASTELKGREKALADAEAQVIIKQADAISAAIPLVGDTSTAAEVRLVTAQEAVKQASDLVLTTSRLRDLARQTRDEAVRSLVRRTPSLAEAAVEDTRVCPYDSTKVLEKPS